MNKYQKATLVQALQYAQRGWHVLPCSYKKTPLTAKGLKDATTDEEQIQQWWHDNPKSLIGIRTGKESGFWVVDVDQKNGKDGWQSLVNHFGDDLELDKDRVLYQRTPSDGLHFCFEYDEDNPVGCGTNYLSGIDVRGDGGYILASPSSILVDGKWKHYAWRDLSREPTPAPRWAIELLELRPGNSQSIKIADILKNGVSEGVRDVSLFRIACLLEREGVDINTAQSSIALLAGFCKPPFDKTTAIEKVNRVYSDYATEQGLKKRLEAIQKQKGIKND